jgi:hypothetical protein
MKLSTSSRMLATAVIGWCITQSGSSATHAAGSLSDLEIEYSELRVAFEKVLGENTKLRQVLAETEKTLADMRKNLAATGGEGEVFKRQAMELKLRLSALGIDSAGGSNAKLEQRLLTAVSDLRLTVDEKKRLSEALIRLTDAASLYANAVTTPTIQPRIVLEAELRNARAALGQPKANALDALPEPSTITDAIAMSVKDDLALVVVNLGSRHGVRVGMPFQVVRDDRKIGTVRVVDVREKISGAVIQNLISEKEPIKQGDRLKVDAQQ